MDERSEQRPKREINTDGLRPLVNYRNPHDDKIQLALQEAARQLKAEGKPLAKDGTIAAAHTNSTSCFPDRRQVLTVFTVQRAVAILFHLPG